MTKQQLAIIIGKNLLKYRTENNYTQEELAEKVGISTSFYANLERGNKSMSLLVLRNLADALQVNTDALLYECNPQCHMQSIYTILRNKSNSFIIAAEKMIRLLSENFE